MAKSVPETMLIEYKDLDKKIAEMKARQEAIRALCEKQGSFETDQFKVTVSDIVQTRMASIEACTQALGMTVKRLKSLGALKRTSFVQVKISRKKVKKS